MKYYTENIHTNITRMLLKINSKTVTVHHQDTIIAYNSIIIGFGFIKRQGFQNILK